MLKPEQADKFDVAQAAMYFNASDIATNVTGMSEEMRTFCCLTTCCQPFPCEHFGFE